MCAKRKASAIKLVDFAKSFYTDLEMDGMLYAVFIRSPVNSGIIKSITHPKLPSGYKLITALDIPGSKVVKILDCEIPIFAETNILYKGEPLGMIVGPNQVVLQELLGEIVIKFVTEDSVCEKKIENTTIKEDDFVESNISEDILEKEKSEILTNDEIVNNINVEDKIEVEENDIEKSIQKDVSEKILFHRSVSFGGDVEQIFSESEIQIEGNYSSVVSSCYNGEPIGALASYKQNVLSIYSPVTWFSQARRTISAVTGIELQQIEIKKTLSAGDNSQKVWYSTILLAQLALATMLCGKPVKIFFSNEEQMSYFARSMPVAVNNRTSINSDGSISSMIISIAVDTGSYNPFVKEIIDRLVIASTGCYFPTNCKIEAYAVSSRAAPVSVNLQRIDSPVFFAIENHIQQICHKIGFLPDEFRLKNSIFTKNFPFKININGIDKVFQSVLKLSDFSRKYSTYRLNSLQRFEGVDLPFSIPIRGIGIASGFEGSGFFGSENFTSNLNMKVTMEIDGSVVIHSYPPSNPIRNIWIKIISEILDVTEEHIRIDSNFDINSEPKHPDGFFGSVNILTHLLRKACLAIQRQRFRQPLPISVSRGITRTQKKQWNSEDFSGVPFFSTANGVAVLEIELDPCTYRIFIREVWISVDGGFIIDKYQAEVSIKSAVREIVAHLIEDDTLEAERIHINFINSDGESKQIGNLVYKILPAAFASAVSQAFSCEINSIPISNKLIVQPKINNKNENDLSQEESE